MGAQPRMGEYGTLELKRRNVRDKRFTAPVAEDYLREILAFRHPIVGFLDERISEETDPLRIELYAEHRPAFAGLRPSREPQWSCWTCADWTRETWSGPPRLAAPCPTLRVIAAMYADHPDYREAWAPLHPPTAAATVPVHRRGGPVLMGDVTDYDRTDRPSTAQPPPRPSTGALVHECAAARALRFGCPRLAALVLERGRFGARKYKTPLRTHNGRNPMADSVEEAGDLVAYLTQADLEGYDVGHLLESAMALGEELTRRVRPGSASPDRRRE